MRWILPALTVAVAFAQGGTDTKPKPEDYEVHAQVNDIALGAEFMIHSFSGQGETYITPDFLVVEVALFPPKGTSLTASDGQFALRINGKKQLLTPANPQMVVATLQHPEWGSGPRIQLGGGLPGDDVTLGGQRPRTPLPAPPDPAEGVPRQPRVKAPDLLLQTAFPEGPHKVAFSGFLYFPYKGKGSSIKSLELIYQETPIKLR
jgi:hypothetical protein